MGYAQAKERHDQLHAEYERTGRALKALSGGGPMGVTPDSVRATPKWQNAKHAADAAFAALRAFNEEYTRRFKREIAQDRDARRASRAGLGDARDDCAAKLVALKHGDPVRIGGKAWEVWRQASDRGEHRSVTVFVIRAGSKGTKLYKLVVKELEQCVVDVCLVNGMAEVIQGPVATGPLP
jgi:hypothetical protein